MKFRVLLQPIMAAIFALRSGLKDAQAGRRPYIWSYFRERHRRREILGEGMRDVGRIFVLAVVLDLVYQAAVLHAFRPLEAAVVGVALAIVPYLIFRGVVNRLFRRGI